MGLLQTAVAQRLGDEFEWDLNLVLKAAEVPELKLGQSGELGWSTWLGRRDADADADEVLVHPNAASE